MTPIGTANYLLMWNSVRVPTFGFRSPVTESWEEDSETVIYGDDLLEEVEPTEAVRATLRRPSVPPAPLQAPRLPSARAVHRREMPTPVMTIQPGPAAFRPESRPPPFPSSAVSIPRAPRVPQDVATPSPADWVRAAPRSTSRPPVATRSGQSDLDTFRPYVGTLAPASGSRLPPPVTFDAFRLSKKSVATWSLGLAALFLAVMAFDRRPQVNAAHPQEAPACTPIVLDGDAIEPIKQPSLVERVRSFDQKALTELANREPMSLSTEEVEALAIGLEHRARENTAQIVGAMAKKPRLTAADKAVFLSHVGNQQTYREALTHMAQNESWQGPDLIYAAMRRYKSRKDISDFAHALLLTHHTYKYASLALTVVIDAETLTECEDVRDLVERAHEDADNRAVLHLVKFAKKTGCGAGGTEDCYPCLRVDSAGRHGNALGKGRAHLKDNALADALRAAQGRMPPAF